MSKIRILATEDDALHEEMLRITLDNLGYELIDVVYEPSKIFLKINATKPDLLLMDIDLGEGVSGIDLMNKINEIHDIPVIYVTSFADSDTFKEAMKTYPAAYVVKPYEEAELQRAIELAFFNKQTKTKHNIPGNSNTILNSYIYIKEDNSLVKIELSSINYIQAYDKYCIIYANDKKRMIRASIKNISEQLPSSIFCQVHRSYIVNMESIDEIEIGNNKIHIAGQEISVSKTYKESLFSRLNYIT